MSGEIPVAVLRAARENAGLTQSQLATRLGITPSVVSRMEKTEHFDRSMAWRYLSAIGTDECGDIREYYEKSWTISDRPSFLHPDRDILWDIEKSLHDLAAFENDEAFDAILARPLGVLRNRLLASAAFLLRTDHNVAWVGAIGVGKTTALSHATGLVLPDDQGLRSIFPTGSGRTTVCEVLVKVAPTFGLAVECLGVDEVRELVVDLVNGLVKKESGVSAEMDRLLRAMADIHRETVTENGKKRLVDPLKAMLDGGDLPEEIVNRLMTRLNLEVRTANKIILSQEKDRGLEWVADNVAKINFGRHPDFGVPTKITVLLPSKLLSSSPFDVTVLDTKGVEGTTQRSDLRALIDDPRTLTVLCTRFNDAPGEKPMELLREVVETRSDAALRGRIAILALSRGDEALAVRGDDGQNPDTAEEGYLIREEQAYGALSREGLPEVPLFFYDAIRDSSQTVWRELNDRIGAMRERYRERARQLSSAADALIADADAAASLEARALIAKSVDRFAQRHPALPSQARPAHQNLVEQVRSGNASSIAASIARRGGWSNFAVHHLLGVGVRADAAARSHRLFIAVDEFLGDLESQFAHLSDVAQSIASMREDVKEWEQEFLGQALALGRVVFKPHLDAANDLWTRCTSRWGAGGGYRDDVANIMQEWFETDLWLDEARRSIDVGLQQAWREIVMANIVAATRTDEDEQQEAA